MSYSQLIQFKRLEERAFIFLNAKQLMFGVLGGFGGMTVGDRLGLNGWLYWLSIGLLVVLGIAAGGIYRGVYGYLYLVMLIRATLNGAVTIRPETLYRRTFNRDTTFSLGAPDGGALVLHQASPTTDDLPSPAPGEAHTYRLSPVDLSQYPPRMVASLLTRWGGFWAGARPPLRVVVHSTPFRADNVVEDVHAAGLIAREPWRVQALSSYGRFLEELTRRSAMYQARHECLVWAHSDTEAHATISSLTGHIGVSAASDRMTPLITGDYEVALDHLRPLDPTQPTVIILVSHEFTGEWQWQDPLVTILRQNFPVSIAIDVERNMAPNEALRKLVGYENVILDVLNNAKTGRNPKAEGALQDIQLAMAKANAGLSLHFTTIVVAVKGETLADARKNVEAIRTLTAARLSLVVLPGAQGELLKFFTPAKRKDINVPELSHNVTSDGMAVISGPLGFRRRSETSGIFWGIGSSGGQDTYPIWWNGFGDDPEKPAAYHGLFLGKSGYGKTVAMNALCYREAMRGTQVVMMEPQGHSKRLAELVGAGASYNPLTLRGMQLNPLDPLSDNLNEQKAFLLDIIRLMLKQIDPARRLTMQEAGLLDAALTAVYEGLDDPLGVQAVHVPRLEQLVEQLRYLGARHLAADLELNYVSGSPGAVFNQPTNLDLNMQADVVTYDFKDIPASSRTLLYTLVLGRVQRLIRAEGRVRRRIIAIDEFGWLAQEPILAETTAMWFKTFRTFGAGVWVAEQDLIRLTGGTATGDLSGHSIIGNSVFQLFFFHEPAAAQAVVDTFPNTVPYRELMETFRRPQETGVAEAVLRLPDGAYHTYMLLAPMERTLVGS